MKRRSNRWDTPLSDLPVVKQCTDPESPSFGAVAVELPEGSPLRAAGEWGVMTLHAGGDIRRDEQVADWTRLDAEQ